MIKKCFLTEHCQKISYQSIQLKREKTLLESFSISSDIVDFGDVRSH